MLIFLFKLSAMSMSYCFFLAAIVESLIETDIFNLGDGLFTTFVSSSDLLLSSSDDSVFIEASARNLFIWRFNFQIP